MRLSRTDVFPALIIMAGGVFGASLSFNFLALSRSADVPAPDPVVVRFVNPESTLRFEISVRRSLMDPLRRDVEEALRRAEDLVREQHYVESSMKRLAEATGVSDRQTRRHLLFERKDAMLIEIADLEREILRLTRVARADQGEASVWLNNAASTIEDDKLKERLRYSRGVIGILHLDYSREFEAETSRIVEELQEELESASRALEARWIRANFLKLPFVDP